MPIAASNLKATTPVESSANARKDIKIINISEEALDALYEIMDFAQLMRIAADGADNEHSSAMNRGATTIMKSASRLCDLLSVEFAFKS